MNEQGEPDIRVPRTAKGEEARRRLMRAGREQFAARGFAQVRVADLTAAAGLSTGAFYRYFKDRHALLLALLSELVNDAYRFARANWDASDPSAAVSETTVRYLDFYGNNRGLFRVMAELASSDAEVRSLWVQAHDDFYSRIARSLERGRKAGVVRAGVDLRVAADLLGSMTEFYAYQRYVLAGDGLVEATVEEVAKVLTDVWSEGLYRR